LSGKAVTTILHRQLTNIIGTMTDTIHMHLG
jgi:hypothetical protein